MDEKKNIETLRDLLFSNALRYGLRDAAVLPDGSGVSYKKLLRDVNSLGTALCKKLSLSKKAVAICGQNCFEWCVSYFSVSCGVGTVVPLDREMDGKQLWNAISFSGCKAAIADKKVCQKLLEAKKRLPHGFRLICFSDDCEFSGVLSFSELLSQGEALLKDGCDAYTAQEIDKDALSVLLFTSGTTGNAKAVMLSHSNLISDLKGVMSRIELSCTDSTLCVLPLHHTYQTIVMLAVLYVGGTVGFCPSLRRMSAELASFKPTVFVTVPLMLEKMHSKIFKRLSSQSGIKRVFTIGKVSQVLLKIAPELRKTIYHEIHAAFGGRVRMIVCGAAALNTAVAEDFGSFGLPVVIGYGLTECSPIIICNSFSEPTTDSVGKPLENCEVTIEAPDENGIGEICVSGPMVMLGYYKNKKATSLVKKGGVFHTGDLGYRDKDGNFHITGRSKNVIVTKGGKNIYPEEIEFYLNSDPVVLESLIFGEERKGDEAVVAQVVPDEDAIKEKLQKEELTHDDINNAVSDVVKGINKTLPSYKSIRRFSIRRKEFEKTSTQKIRRSSSEKTTAEESGIDEENRPKSEE